MSMDPRIIQLLQNVAGSLENIIPGQQAVPDVGAIMSQYPQLTGMGGAAPSPTPQERDQRQGYRLNPYEQNLTGALQAGVEAGLDPRTATEMLMGTIQGAIARRQQNTATRNEGLMGLQEMAMQLAQSGADPTAVQGALGNMAGNLPGMNGPRGQGELQGLMDFVNDIYQGQPVSGLMPYDYRQQLGSAGQLDPEDQQGIGSVVIQGVTQGMPFVQIRENIRREALAQGYDPGQVEQAVRFAEHTYEQAVGTPLTEMRGVGDLFRTYEGAGQAENFFGAIDNPDLRGNVEQLYGMLGSPQAVLGALGTQPGAIQQLANDVRPLPDQPTGGGNDSPFAWLYGQMVNNLPKIVEWAT